MAAVSNGSGRFGNSRMAMSMAGHHLAYGDELLRLGAYRAAQAHFVEASSLIDAASDAKVVSPVADVIADQAVVDEVGSSAASDDDDDDIEDDVGAVTQERCLASIAESRKRFTFERRNLAALIALDRGRGRAASQIIDDILQQPILDDDTRQYYQSKRVRANRIAADQDQVQDAIAIADAVAARATTYAAAGLDTLSITAWRLAAQVCSDALASTKTPTPRISIGQAPVTDAGRSRLMAIQQDAMAQARRASAAVASTLPAAMLGDLVDAFVERQRHQCEDIGALLADQDTPEADRDALIRPSQVGDITIDGKLWAARQAAVIVDMLAPGRASAILDDVALHEQHRALILDRRRGAARHQIEGKFDQVVKDLDQANGAPSRRAHVVHDLLSTVASAYRDPRDLHLLSTANLSASVARFNDAIAAERAADERQAAAMAAFVEGADRHLRRALAAASTWPSDKVVARARQASSLYERARQSPAWRARAERGLLRSSQLQEAIRCRDEAARCGAGDRERALRWAMRAAVTIGDALGAMQGVDQAADALVVQSRARANLAAAVTALDALIPTGASDDERRVGALIGRARDLDPSDAVIGAWSRAFRLCQEGMSARASRDYKRAKAIFDECNELAPSEAFRRAGQEADNLAYKAELRAATERLAAHATAPGTLGPMPVNLSSRISATRIESLVDGVVGDILDGDDPDRADYREAIVSVLQAHPLFDDGEIWNDDELADLRRALVDAVAKVLGHTMADVEVVVHQAADERQLMRQATLSPRSRAMAQDDLVRRASMRLTARAMRVAADIGATELHLEHNMFRCLRRRILACQALVDRFADVDAMVDAGTWIGRQLDARWFPEVEASSGTDDVGVVVASGSVDLEQDLNDNDSTNDDLIADEVIAAWQAHDDAVRGSDENAWRSAFADLVHRSGVIAQRLVDEPMTSLLHARIKHHRAETTQRLASAADKTSQVDLIAMETVAGALLDLISLRVRARLQELNVAARSARAAFPMALRDRLTNLTRTLPAERDPAPVLSLKNVVRDIVSVVEHNPIDTVDVWRVSIALAFDAVALPTPSSCSDEVIVEAATTITSQMYTARVVSSSAPPLENQDQFERRANRVLLRHFSSEHSDVVERVRERPRHVFAICKDMVGKIATNDARHREPSPTSASMTSISSNDPATTAKSASSGTSKSVSGGKQQQRHQQQQQLQQEQLPSQQQQAFTKDLLIVIRKLVAMRVVPLDANSKTKQAMSAWIDDILTRSLSAGSHARFLNSLALQTQRASDHAKTELADRIAGALRAFPIDDVVNGKDAPLQADAMAAVRKAITDCKNNLRH
ncbi:Uncharacterized protein PBTT_02229 [Plasmodiophora brassicae]